jgi:hypothetical protein
MKKKLKTGCGIINQLSKATTLKTNLTNKDLREAFFSNEVKYIFDDREPTKEEKHFNKNVWSKMTDEEKEKLCFLSLSGILQDDKILMGRAAFDRYMDYKNELIEKYDTTRNKD